MSAPPARPFPRAAAALLLAALLPAAGLFVLGLRALDAEEAKAELRARAAASASLRALAARAAAIATAIDLAAEGMREDDPPPDSPVQTLFLASPSGEILLPRLRRHDAVEPPAVEDRERLVKYISAVGSDFTDPAEFEGAALLLEAGIGDFPHPDLVGEVLLEAARLYERAERPERASHLLEILLDDMPEARDADGVPLMPRAGLRLAGLTTGEARNERLTDLALALADHAFGLSHPERDDLLAEVGIQLGEEGLPDVVRERIFLVDTIRSRLVPGAVSLLSGEADGAWHHHVEMREGLPELFGWRAVTFKDRPHVLGYRSHPGIFGVLLDRAADEAERVHGARLIRGEGPEGIAGDLGGDLQTVRIRAIPPEPAGPGALRALHFLTSILLMGALVLALFLALRTVRREVSAARLKQEFADHVSHELRTPLTTIRMYAEMLSDEDDLPEPKRHEYLGRVLGESERMSRLVEDVLDYSRRSRGVAPPEAVSVDVAKIILAAKEHLIRRIEEEAFLVSVEVPEDLPPARAAPESAARALANLVENAMKYSGESREITIRARVEDELIAVTVVDRGPGIPEDARDRLFERFFRAPSDARGPGGVGLGLALAREIARAQGGDVRLLASSTKGSQFVLTLPRASAEEEA